MRELYFIIVYCCLLCVIQFSWLVRASVSKHEWMNLDGPSHSNKRLLKPSITCGDLITPLDGNHLERTTEKAITSINQAITTHHNNEDPRNHLLWNEPSRSNRDQPPPGTIYQHILYLAWWIPIIAWEQASNARSILKAAAATILKEISKAKQSNHKIPPPALKDGTQGTINLSSYLCLCEASNLDGLLTRGWTYIFDS